MSIMIRRAITSSGMTTQVGFTQLSLTSFGALRFISIFKLFISGIPQIRTRAPFKAPAKLNFERAALM